MLIVKKVRELPFAFSYLRFSDWLQEVIYLNPNSKS